MGRPCGGGPRARATAVYARPADAVVGARPRQESRAKRKQVPLRRPAGVEDKNSEPRTKMDNASSDITANIFASKNRANLRVNAL